MEKLLFSLLALVATIPLLRVAHRSFRRAWPLALGLLAFYGTTLALWEPGGDPALQDALPERVEEGGFVGSEVCRSCHPDQYSSWHASFHRTMTQPATPKAVLADFDDVHLEDRGEVYNLERRGDQFWVEMKALWRAETADGRDLSRLPSLPRVRQRILMTTGSHHFQTFWVKVPEFNGMFFQFPWYFQVAEQRWIPAADSFLKPPSPTPERTVMWNETCLDCHTVGGQPRLEVDERTMYSRVAELGIACEACHGPAAEHVRANRQPLRRYFYHFSDRPDPTIVNPSQLDASRGSSVCGQCHSVTGPLDPQAWSIRGRSFRPGQKLEETRRIVRYSESMTDPFLQQWLRETPDALSGRFWSDGTVRVAGREYNGLIESKCFQQGDLSCLSCHSMHESDANDQLAQGMEGDEACLPCHAGYLERISQHTHHAEDSTGSRCYNCHMPYTTFGLFTAMRAHRIDNPSVARSLSTGRPNACNLCHLDRSLMWAASRLSEWYGQPELAMNQTDQETSAALLWLLEGDAAQRAIAVWSMGWEPALAASGRHWEAPFVAQLLSDPYSAVRFVAHRSLTHLPGYDSFDFDFIAGPNELRKRRQAALDQWTGQDVPTESRRPQVLISPSGELQLNRLLELLKQRDDRKVRIIE